MHSGHIKGATRHLGPPQGWNSKKHGHCATLPIRDEQTTAGQGMTSAWYPTQEEIAKIAVGAPIYLTIIGVVHPPVCMGVGPVPYDEVEPSKLNRG